MSNPFYQSLNATLQQIQNDGFYKRERQIATPQNSKIKLGTGAEVINFCANNYLGLADDARLVAAAKQGLDDYGFGMASVRFICGTQTSHRQLEGAISRFLGTEDTILYGVVLRRERRACSKRSSERRTPSSPMHSITPASLTAYVSARRNAFATRTTIWPIWKRN